MKLSILLFKYIEQNINFNYNRNYKRNYKHYNLKCTVHF